MKNLNHATLLELESQINEFKNIIKTANGCERDLFIKLLNSAEYDLKTGNYNK